MDWDKHKPFKITALFCYLIIILQGSFIALPFGFWLIFTAFEFGNPDQLYAILGVVGLGYSMFTISSSKYSITLETLLFILLLTPILRRMFSTNLEAFYYPSFIIPLTLFLVLYVLSLWFIAAKPNKRV